MTKERPRPVCILAVLAAMLGSAAGGAASTADAATLAVGRGASKAKIQRPGVHIDDWGVSILSASAKRSQGVVFVWTEVTRAPGHRWWWRTYTSWCTQGRCSRAVKALESNRSVRKTPKNTVTPWRVWVSADATRDRAVVKAGIRWGSRWAITGRTRLISRGPTDNVWNAGYIAITHTPDGRDWLSWNNDHERIRISPARNGQRLGGPIIARGDTAQVRYIGGRWVLLSLGRTSDFEDYSYPVNLKTATTVAGLRPARPTKLAKLGHDDFLGLFGPDDGPLLATWESITDPNHVRPIGNGAWIDQAGTLSAPQVLPSDRLSSSSLRSVLTPSGGLMLCPWNLSAPLGGAFQPQPGACKSDVVSPLRGPATSGDG